MNRDDSLLEYDDLLEFESTHSISPDEFQEAAGSEPDRIGWLVVGIVLDEEEQLLCIEQPWADGWLFPAGVPKQDEPLSEALVREVHEETGVTVTPVRPHGVEEYTFIDEVSGDEGGWTVVFYEATAETTTTAADPGLEDEEITDVRWFDELPEELYNQEIVESVVDRCLESSGKS